MALRPLGGKYVGRGGALMTPDQVAEQRKIAQALAVEASDTSPVGHWSAALNRALQGGIAGYELKQAREAENAGLEAAQAKLANRATFGGADPVAAALGGAGGAQPYTAPAEAAAIREGLIARGLPEHVADGFIMNFQDESGLNPGINEAAPLIPGSRGGFGLYQLTGPRRTAYEQFASQRGVDPSDVDAQLDWLMYELQGPEAKAAQSIFSAGSAGEAGAAIVNNFLRPAVEHRQSRASRYLGGASAPAAGGGNRSMDIAALLSDPWVAQAAGPALQAELQQAQAMERAQYEAQLKQADPMYQAQLQGALLANQKAAQPVVSDYDQRAAAADQFGLQGDARQAFILTGDIPGLSGANTPAQIQELQWRAQEAGLLVGSPEYQKFILNGGRAENNRPAAVEAAHQLALLAGYEEGTPGYQEFIRTKGAGEVAAAQVAGKTAAEMEIAAPAEINSADDALRYIDEIRNHPGRKAGTGASSYAWNWIPGTEAYSFANRVKQLGGGAFLTAIGEMQGMGALSNQEGQTAKDAIARLDTAVTEDEFIAALDDYQRIIQRGKDRAHKRLKVTDAAPDASKGEEESDDDFLKRMGLQ